MNCHPQNREMQALARKFQADIAIDRTTACFTGPSTEPDVSLTAAPAP
jgi:hypothetical protein